MTGFKCEIEGGGGGGGGNLNILIKKSLILNKFYSVHLHGLIIQHQSIIPAVYGYPY